MWKNHLKADPTPWLLEADPPGVRYLAMRELLDLPENDPELAAARRDAYEQGPMRAVLEAMEPLGYWVRSGAGYNPKYRSAVWSLLMLAQLGASIADDERIDRACEYYLEHALADGGQFSLTGTPAGTIDCLQGNMCWALVALGCTDSRLEPAFEWMARTVTGEGISPISDRQASRHFLTYKHGPLFECSANNYQPCAWGAVKVMLALGRWPKSKRTPVIEAAIRQGVDFLLSSDPAEAKFPTRLDDKPSRNWWKFGFPVFYVTDILQLVEALVGLGFGNDPRLANALQLICDKQDDFGRWALEYDYTGKTWADIGPKKQPNKWVTLRALRVLKSAGDGDG